MARSKKAATLAPLDSTPMQVFRKHGDGVNGTNTLYVAPATLSPAVNNGPTTSL